MVPELTKRDIRCNKSYDSGGWGVGGKLVVSTFGHTLWTAVSEQSSPDIALERAF